MKRRIVYGGKTTRKALRYTSEQMYLLSDYRGADRHNQITVIP